VGRAGTDHRRGGEDDEHRHGEIGHDGAWGDQWTNAIQPFWALPLLGLAGLSAKDIMGYTTMVLLWIGLVLSLFALMIGFGIL
jgi:short-chain fatty acids transporter